MSATNHTTNYNLPQFVGTDKPTWLTDVNGAMSAIDTQMKANADSATTANSTATTASTNLGNIANLNTTDKTSAVSAINEVNTGLGTVSGVASSASGDATTALTKISALERFLNFTQFKQYVNSEVTATGGTSVTVDSLGCACNADGTVGKIYGSVRLHVSSSNGFTISIPTFFRPESAIAINGVAWSARFTPNGIEDAMNPSTMNIATNGTVTVSKGGSYYNKDARIDFVACVLFLKDFGDIPQE